MSVSVRRFMMDAYKHLHVFIILPQQRSHNREKTTVDKETKTNMSIQETMNNDNSKRCNVKSDRFKIESKRRSPFPHTHTYTHIGDKPSVPSYPPAIIDPCAYAYDLVWMYTTCTLYKHVCRLNVLEMISAVHTIRVCARVCESMRKFHAIKGRRRGRKNIRLKCELLLIPFIFVEYSIVLHDVRCFLVFLLDFCLIGALFVLYPITMDLYM